jgi:PAS domain S-box-containing protein
MEGQRQPGKSRTPSHLEKEENWLWRTALLFLILMATGLAAESWDQLQDLPYHLGLLSIAVLFVALAFAGFAYGRRKRVSELKALVQDLQVSAPTEQQLDQLGQIIARSQRSFKELIDSFDDAAFAISLDGKLRTVNRRMAQLLGIAYGELVGHKLDEFLEEPKLQDVNRGLSRFLEKRRWSGVVQVQRKADRRVLYFDCVLNAIVKEDEVVGASALARDVTEEREKERRFTELFETLQEGVYFCTPEGKLLDANPALVRILGYEEKEELLSLDAKALQPDPNQSAVLGRSAGDEGGVRVREITLRRKNGKLGIFQDTSRAVWDPSGMIVRYQGTLVDVTERREMENALHRQEEFRRSLLESFPDLILVIDRGQRISFVSSRVRDLLGYSPQDWMGKKLPEEPDYSPEMQEIVDDLLVGRKTFGSCECPLRHEDGSWRNMRASAGPLYDDEGRTNGVIVSLRDITVEKKLEQQIIQSERLAAMGQMIGGFAHELNNPLTSILGMSELLQDSGAMESAQKQLETLQQQARRAVEIVQNLTYFSRPPAPGKAALDVAELVQRTLHLHAYSLRKNNITVDFLREPTVPSVQADAHQLMQVFLNLILNSEQAIREVRDRGTLRIRLEKKDRNVLVIFQDDGPGISPEILPHIFDPFYTTKRPGRGTGLGLSICKAILREHNGNVEAMSGPGGGAVFTVTLPMAEAAPAAAGAGA